MAILTWREVSAPDYRGSADGLRIAAGSWDRAFQGLSQGLDKFDAARRTDAENAVLNNAANYSSADALRAAITDGSVFNGVNRNLVGARALNALDARGTTLLGQDAAQQNLSTQRELDPLRISDAQSQNRVNLATEPVRIERPAADLAAVRANTAQTGAQTEGINLTNNYNRQTLPGRVAANQAQNETIVQTAPSQREATISGNELTTDNNRRGVVQNADRDTGLNAASNAIATTTNFADARQVIESDTTLSPLARSAAIEEARRHYTTPGNQESITGGPGATPAAPALAAAVTPPSNANARPPAGAPGSGSGTGASGAIASTASQGAAPALGAFGTQNGRQEDVVFRNLQTSAPISESTIGQVHDFQTRQLLPATGGSPVGRYQITEATIRDYAPRVFGENWRNVQFSAENQDRIARAIFEDRKNGNLRGTWSTLPDSRPGAYANMTWEQMRGRIAAAEAPVRNGPGQSQAAGPPVMEPTQIAANARANVTQILGDLTARQSQNAAPGIQARYGEVVSQNDMTVNDAAQALIKKGGMFAGADAGQLGSQIQDIISRAQTIRGAPPINAATAAAILEKSTTGADEVNLGSWGQALGLRQGVHVNDRGITEELQNVTSFIRNQQQGVIGANASTQEALNSALARVTAAAGNLAEQQRAVDRSPQRRAGPGLARAEEEVNRAQTALDTILTRVRNDPNTFSPRFANAPGNSGQQVARQDTPQNAPQEFPRNPSDARRAYRSGRWEWGNQPQQ